nr:colicin Ia central receptor-binding domain-containing protein [Escherichia coli]
MVSPEKFPGRSSTNHSIVVSGDPRFAGTIKITTSAVIDNRAKPELSSDPFRSGL